MALWSANGSTVSLRWFLPALLLVLVLSATLPIIVVAYGVAKSTSDRLHGVRADLLVDGLEARVRELLDPVVEAGEAARNAVSARTVDLGSNDARRGFLAGIAAAVSPTATVRFIPFGEASALPEGTAGWSAPFAANRTGEPTFEYVVPLRNGDAFLGHLAFTVNAGGLSGDNGTDLDGTPIGGEAFVLYGRDRLIVHAGAQEASRSDAALIPVERSAEPVIAAVWTDSRPIDQPHDRTEAHWTFADGVPYAYLSRTLTGYGAVPLTLVLALPSAESRYDRWAPAATALLSVVLSALVALFAWWIGRRAALVTGRIDEETARMEALDFASVRFDDLTGSRVAELRSTSMRLDRLAHTLDTVQTYLPKALTRRLLQRGGSKEPAQERTITVMFLDLEGFTAFAKGRSAAEVAQLLNALFALVGPPIEASDGVIDKYTGDGLMAFWGAPEVEPAHAALALNAAAAVAATIEDDGNFGVRSPRVRIGFHTGPAIVGDVGFEGRTDYTIVGDTPNVAQRVESSLRGVSPDSRVVVGASETTLLAAGLNHNTELVGEALPAAPVPAHLLRLHRSGSVSSDVPNDYPHMTARSHVE